jgi:hypothetical protein
MSIEAPHTEPGWARRPIIALSDAPLDAVALDAAPLDAAPLDAAPDPTPWREPTAVLAALPRLVASPELAVVLTSLAAVCSPAMAEQCWGTLSEAGAVKPIGMAPAGEAGPPSTPTAWTMPLAGADQLSLNFSLSAWEDYPECSGTMNWRWQDRDRPTRSDKVIARLLLDRALELVRAQRLEAAVAVERDKSANLQVALVTNREIAQAIGILMSAYKLTSQQGFDLLRTASQHTHRKLREVAAEVCDTGMLDLPASR